MGRAPGTDEGARPWVFSPQTSIDYMDHLASVRGFERLTAAEREALGTNVLPLFPNFARRIGAAAPRGADRVAAE